MANLKTLKQYQKQEVYQKQYRVGEDVLIMFANKDQIYTRDLISDHWLLYHRGMQIKGTYPAWYAFMKNIKRRKRITNQDIYNLAFKYEIDCMGVYKKPILDESYKKIGEK